MTNRERKVTDNGRASVAHRGVPWFAWVLLAGAGMQVVVYVARDWYQLFGPYLIVRPQLIADAAASTMPFLLGAALLVGVDRWSEGRRWLYAAAAVLGVLGLLRVASEVWWALWSTSAEPIAVPAQAGLIVVGVATSLAGAAAPLLIAFGLHAARSANALTRAWLIGAVLVLGVTTVIGVLVLAVQWVPQSPDALSTLGIATHVALHAAAAAAMTLVALAAMRAARTADALPEVLVAAGAVASVLALGWPAWFQVVVPLERQPELTTIGFVGPMILGAAGMLVMAAGFALGRVLARDHRPIREV